MDEILHRTRLYVKVFIHSFIQDCLKKDETVGDLDTQEAVEHFFDWRAIQGDIAAAWDDHFLADRFPDSDSPTEREAYLAPLVRALDNPRLSPAVTGKLSEDLVNELAESLVADLTREIYKAKLKEQSFALRTVTAFRPGLAAQR